MKKTHQAAKKPMPKTFKATPAASGMPKHVTHSASVKPAGKTRAK